MEVVIVNDADEIGDVVAEIITSLLVLQPQACLGLATGSSPLPVYRSLQRRHAAGEVSFADARCFLLDEYVGLPLGHPASYRSVIQQEFTTGVHLPAAALDGPDGAADDIAAECDDYERRINAAGGIDLQLLGIGTDGHIGFNEPTSSLASLTRIKSLYQRTRDDNARFFASSDEVPRHVITQGIGTILRSRHAVLIASGDNKAAPIAAAVEGPLTAMVPASALQLHRHVTVVIDESAAAQLQLADYYRATLASKPRWQPH